ncbi:hypothetical protein BJY52DRAFT_156330 [Lactarius psammicola]|nr:hypothetical protein BJY52DRAFT_156330 [Lactarius psammicola]
MVYSFLSWSRNHGAGVLHMWVYSIPMCRTRRLLLLLPLVAPSSAGSISRPRLCELAHLPHTFRTNPYPWRVDTAMVEHLVFAPVSFTRGILGEDQIAVPGGLHSHTGSCWRSKQSSSNTATLYTIFLLLTKISFDQSGLLGQQISTRTRYPGDLTLHSTSTRAVVPCCSEIPLSLRTLAQGITVEILKRAPGMSSSAPVVFSR